MTRGHRVFGPAGRRHRRWLAVGALLASISLALTGCDQPNEPTSANTAAIAPGDLALIQSPNGPVLSSVEAHRLRDAAADLIFVSVRERDEWDRSHIPGAVWIPTSRLRAGDEFSWKRIESLARSHKYVVLYCVSGRRSGDITQRANERGLSNVFSLDGITAWKQHFPVVEGDDAT